MIGPTTFENTQIGTGKSEIDISLENGPINRIIYWILEAATMWKGIGGSFFVVIKSDSLHHDGRWVMGEASKEQVTTNFGFRLQTYVTTLFIFFSLCTCKCYYAFNHGAQTMIKFNGCYVNWY